MKKKAKQNVRLKGQLKLYMQWPAFMSILLVAMNIWIYRLDRKAGLLMMIFVLIYIVIVGIMYFYNKSLVMKDLVDFAAQYGIVQNTLLKKLAVPYAILLEDGRLMWMNEQFREILGNKVKGEAVLSRYIPELNRSIFPKDEEQTVEMEVYFNSREYRAELRKVSVEGFSDSERLLDMPEEKEYFVAVYLSDVTELNVALRQNEEQRLVQEINSSAYWFEVDALRACAPDVPVTTNMMGYFDGLDYWRVAEVCDFISDDVYPGWGIEPDVRKILSECAMRHDMHRAMKDGRPFLIMESAPSATNWMPGHRLKRPNQHKLEELTAIGHGADGAMYFQWRKGRNNCEKFHGAVVGHDGTADTRTFRSVAEFGRKLERIAEVAGSRRAPAGAPASSPQIPPKRR